jgi:hypothetical protein
MVTFTHDRQTRIIERAGSARSCGSPQATVDAGEFTIGTGSRSGIARPARCQPVSGHYNCRGLFPRLALRTGNS